MGFFLPAVCAACGEPGRAPLCAACEQSVPWITHPMCERCGAPGVPCRECTGRVFAFRSARAVALYDGPARDALITFKVLGDRRSAAALARPMAAAAAATAPNPDAVAFVPGTRRSDAQRGFNPSAELARPVARALRAPLKRLLAKTRETPDASGLTKHERALVLRDAFTCVKTAPKIILLVDDILTTGATADACSRALLGAGAEAVDVVVFARAAKGPLGSGGRDA